MAKYSPPNRQFACPARGVDEVGRAPVGKAWAFIEARKIRGFGRKTSVHAGASVLAIQLQADNLQIQIGAVGEYGRVLTDAEPHSLQIGQVLNIVAGSQHRAVEFALEALLISFAANISLPQVGHLHPVVVCQHRLHLDGFQVGFLRNIEEVDKLLVAISTLKLRGRFYRERGKQAAEVGLTAHIHSCFVVEAVAIIGVEGDLVAAR